VRRTGKVVSVALLLWLLGCGLVWGLLAFAPKVPVSPPDTVQAQIMRRTGLITDGEGQGTITLVRRGGVTWGLTCAHCVTGSPLFVQVYNPDALLDAELVVRSDDEDLAVVRIPTLSRDLPDLRLASVSPAVGTSLIHVGNFHGRRMPLSFSTGVYSGNNREIEGQRYDQTTVVSLPGSSGGGVYTPDGVYVGMVARGAASDVNFIIPAEHIREWAITHNVDFLFEPGLRVPKLPTSRPAVPVDVGLGLAPLTPIHIWPFSGSN